MSGTLRSAETSCSDSEHPFSRIGTKLGFTRVPGDTQRVSRWTIRLRPAGLQLATAAALLVSPCLLSGCGGKDAPPPAQTTTAAAPAGNPAPATDGSVSHPSPDTPPAGPAPSSGSKETKWIGNIPYDVFFDQPLTIAADTTSLTSAGTPAPANNPATAVALSPAAAMPASPATAAPAAAAPAAGNPVNWGEILPMSMLVEEVKLLRTNLTGNLQTVATFNKSQKPIALDGAMLTAMATVATVHPEPVSWKPNAHFVRDLAFQINENSTGTGREPYTRTKEPFDKILVILDGGKPPEMDSPETIPFSEVVYVADIMKRIEYSFNNLKANINTDAKLKENAADAEREIRILLTLGTMMGDKSYDNTDQPAYQGFLKRFTDGARSGAQAIHTGNLPDFQAALNQIQTTCAECHQQYRGSESGF